MLADSIKEWMIAFGFKNLCLGKKNEINFRCPGDPLASPFSFESQNQITQTGRNSPVWSGLLMYLLS